MAKGWGSGPSSLGPEAAGEGGLLGCGREGSPPAREGRDGWARDDTCRSGEDCGAGLESWPKPGLPHCRPAAALLCMGLIVAGPSAERRAKKSGSTRAAAALTCGHAADRGAESCKNAHALALPTNAQLAKAIYTRTLPASKAISSFSLCMHGVRACSSALVSTCLPFVLRSSSPAARNEPSCSGSCACE